MIIKRHLCALFVFAAAFCCGQRAFAQTARVDISYLPQSLVAASHGDRDVSVEVELIFRETGGASVRFDQLNRSFVLSSGMSIADPVSFISMQLAPGSETHEQDTLTIPSGTASLCMGGFTTCDLTVKFEYSGLDERGNIVTATLDLPVKITRDAAAATFAVGDLMITSPADGARVDPAKTKASGNIEVTGVGPVAGQWLLNGKTTGNFSKDVMGEGEITLDLSLKSAPAGKNTLVLRVTQPVLKESAPVGFTVMPPGVPAGDVKTFNAGPVAVKDVAMKADTGGQTGSGSGTAVISSLDIETPVTFSGLYIAAKDKGAALADGRILADVNNTLERGPLKVTITQMLITADGAWADGSATLEPTVLSAGIGPLYFYSLPIDANGIGGVTKLEPPQKGTRGDYEVSVDKFELKFGAGEAALKASGVITSPSKPGWKAPLDIAISLGPEK